MLGYLLLTVTLLLITYAIYNIFFGQKDYFLKRHLETVDQKYALANIVKLFTRKFGMNEQLVNLYNKFPDARLYGYFDFGKPIVFMRDPELIKKLTIKEFDYFTDHKLFIDGNDSEDLFSNSLILMKGNKWRQMRATLSPAFTGSKMRQMFELVSECAIDMSDHLKERADKEEKMEFEVKDLFRRYTNDVIASCAFGYKVNSFKDENNEFLKTGSQIMNFFKSSRIIRILFIIIFPKLAKKLGFTFIGKKESNYFRSLILDSIEERERQGIFRPDMINTIMQLKKGTLQNHQYEDHNLDAGFATVQEFENNQTGEIFMENPKWTDNELIAQCFLFFVAGFDTTSTLLSFALYELAVNTDVQSKLYEEIKIVHENLFGGRIKYDTLQKMTYLDQTISEALRMWPPAMITDRQCSKDYVLEYDANKPTFTFEKGIQIWIPIYAIHHDSQYFPNPEKFDPDRFSVENRNSINSNAFIPFGIGPRNCIGSRFALMEIKAVIYSILLNFEIIVTQKTQIPLRLSVSPIGVEPRKPITLEFKLRNTIK